MYYVRNKYLLCTIKRNIIQFYNNELFSIYAVIYFIITWLLFGNTICYFLLKLEEKYHKQI